MLFFNAETHIRKVARRVNPLIETNLGTLLWCGSGNCDMFCPVELKKSSTINGKFLIGVFVCK